tara:strand:+ start:1775 stop:2317 length:543 start_codon:yes stop_codon:yes gene_type:complete
MGLFTNSIFPAGGEGGAGGGIIKITQTNWRGTAYYDPSNNIFSDETDITNLDCSLTPETNSNKILVIYRLNISIGGTTGGSRLKRKIGSGSYSEICLGNSSNNRSRVTSTVSVHQGEWRNNEIVHFLDSPNTTSACTYRIGFNTHDGRAFSINRSMTDSDSSLFDNARSTSSLTLMEISS